MADSLTHEETQPLALDDDIEQLSELGSELICAVWRADVKSVKDLIDAGAPLWYQMEPEGISALHAAAYTENEELVNLLIEEGAIWNAGKPACTLLRLSTMPFIPQLTILETLLVISRYRSTTSHAM